MPERINEIVVFRLHEQHFAVPANQVVEIARAGAIVPLPNAPTVVEGVINLHGSAAPVYDLRCRFQLPPKPLDPSDHFVIARTGRRTVVLRVDRVVELRRIMPEEMVELTSVVEHAESIRWVLSQAGEILLIHDVDTFLSRAEEAMLESALATESNALFPASGDTRPKQG